MSKTKALVIRQIELAPQQMQAIQRKTPEMFVRTKPGRGGKKVKFVEIGYVVNTLNEVFLPPNWDFEILAQGETERKNDGASEGEVWVRGRLTIIDHKNGYKVGKTQYGQHPIHKNVPIGDSFKAAASDCLKKCASLFGIGLDVMWGEMEETKNAESKKKDPKAMFEIAKKMIESCRVPTTIIAMDEKIQSSKVYSKEQKAELQKIASRKIDGIDQAQ